MVNRYFQKEDVEIQELEAKLEEEEEKLKELQEEESSENGALYELEKRADIKRKLKECEGNLLHQPDNTEVSILQKWLSLDDSITKLRNKLKEKNNYLNQTVLEKYKSLTEDEIKTLVIEDKWLAELEKKTNAEFEQLIQSLTSRLLELAERYAVTLPEIEKKVEELSNTVKNDLKRMGIVWE